ncbi:hypothetical protein [Sphingomonas sp. LM7]|uniref:hypothetical protein n=1 Tax=Sphingomonas sp. LM7 TaxID=1938607 RepID=UPI00209A7B57|nr:hypothetical protein [Sphingomonas sp. LM7]
MLAAAAVHAGAGLVYMLADDVAAEIADGRLIQGARRMVPTFSGLPSLLPEPTRNAGAAGVDRFPSLESGDRD